MGSTLGCSCPGPATFRSCSTRRGINATIIGRAFAREMEQMFGRDLETAREVKLEAWRSRPISDRAIQAFASAVKFWI